MSAEGLQWITDKYMKIFLSEKYIQNMIYATYANSQDNYHPTESGTRTRFKPPGISPQNLRVDCWRDSDEICIVLATTQASLHIQKIKFMPIFLLPQFHSDILMY